MSYYVTVEIKTFGKGKQGAEMNLSIDHDEDFIKGDHPVSAFSTTQIGKLNCVLLIRL